MYMFTGEKHFQRGLCPAPRDVERSALQLASVVGADSKELGRIHACWSFTKPGGECLYIINYVTI